MGGFEDPYWNLIETLAWVYLGDRAVVQRASDDVTDHGTFWQEMRLPDGRKELVETPASALGPIHLEVIAAQKGASLYQTLDDAENVLLGALRNGRLNALGLENNMGDLLEIPLAQWAGLKFYFGPSRAGPLNIARVGATHWHGLKFSRSEVLEIWPDPFQQVQGGTTSTSETILTEEARRKGGSKSKFNKGLQTFVDSLFVEFADGNEPFTLSTFKDWLRKNAASGEGYEPDPAIPDCGDIVFYDDKLWWKDRRGAPQSVTIRTVERYISRAKVQTV